MKNATVKICLTLTLILAICAILSILIAAFFSSSYPLKYKSEIEILASKYDVSPALVSATINVESAFKNDAVSKKGAVGLMQIMPSTAADLAARLNIKSEDVDLKDPIQNIELGTFYLSRLIKQFGSLDLAVCAYNAGPATVKSWLQNENFSADGQTLDEIPYPETRNYLNKIKKNLRYYNRKFK